MEEEINRAASLLKGLPRGYMPKPLFYAMAEKIVLPTVGLMVFRRAKTGVELLLTQRLNNDPYWPAGWHLPGTVLLATDREGDYSSAFERILKDELYGAVRLKTEPELVSINFW